MSRKKFSNIKYKNTRTCDGLSSRISREPNLEETLFGIPRREQLLA
jgi:hypothetical protein